jgi:ribonucleotide reductase alpha subunit
MKDCNIGDNLYTIDGSLKPILQISINEVDKEILSITNDIVRKPIRVTKEHQIYARLKDCKPEYINATDLNKNYYVSYPKYNEQIHKSNSELLNLNKKIEETNDYYIDDYLYWVPIRSIDVIHYKGDVYDFNMMDNHNYLTDMGIVHNSGKRNGSFAMYLEPHHIDIMSFLEAKKNHGDENSRARDLFYAVWLSDLFMERVKNKQMWSLMDPDTCKGLSEVYGNEYKKLYEEYEKDPTKVIKQVPALDVWKEIIKSQMETGTPYICYKDAGNEKSNQKNYGTIKSSNLCTEIYEYSDHKEYACCTLASIALPTYVEEFDYSTINSIDVYTKSDCKFCNYSKGFLKTRGLTYTEHNLDDEIVRGDFFKELNKKSGGIECDGDNCRIVLKNKRFTSVPQIFINGEHIGGFAELYAYFKPTFNYKKLYDVTKVITRNLNKVIDLNFYPVPETRISNFRHRPIGIGVQGLADVYAKYRVSFDSQLASELNKEIFATIYYASCEASYELAQEFATHIQNNMSLSPENRDPMILPEDIEMYNNNDRYLGSYHTFKGSPISQGQFQFDLWKASPLKSVGCVYNDDGSIKSVLNGGVVFNWEELRHKIMEQGMRNSLLLAPMPTASTSQILGNNECIEPFTSNIYSRGTLAGQFVVLNKYLMNDLQSIGVWSNDLMDTIILNNGSINGINAIPEVIRNTYKVVWDLSMKALIDQAADRGIYICQSQSLNLWLEDPDLSKLTSMHFYAWQKGLKTGIYYLRRRAVSKAQTFSIDATKTSVNKNDSSKESDCLMCSS